MGEGGVGVSIDPGSGTSKNFNHGINIMGGDGSGRWGTSKPDAKILTDDCLALDMKLLVRAGVVRPNANHQGSWEWRKSPHDEKPSCNVGFEVKTGGDAGIIRLQYAVTILQAGGERVPESMAYPMSLVTTRLPPGGRRWWFRCQAQRGEAGTPCGRRVGKLFLPLGGRFFACRHCYELAYESSRSSHAGGRMWAELGAAVGISGPRARRMMSKGSRESREERREKEAGQKAVFATEAGGPLGRQNGGPD